MAFTYLIIDSFSIVFLLILYASMREQSSSLSENRRFCYIMLMTVAALLCDLFAWQLDGQSGDVVRLLLWFFNTLCYVLSGLMALNWLLYVAFKLNGGDRLLRAVKLVISLPCLFLAAASLLTPWTGWLFYLDANNVYQRGGLFVIQMIIPFSYILAAAVWAAVRAGRARLRQQRREYLFLSSFILFPFLGGILQLSVYGLSLAWPSTALSLMLVYVNLQNQKISLDALTGLNNRGQLDKYLYNCMERSEEGPPFALFMLDIDEFKVINDQLGHTAGDAALVESAEILKRALGGIRAFIARYGGDEFAVVLHYTNDAQIDAVIERIEHETALFNTRQGVRHYSLVFSIGYVCGDSKRFSRYQDMITAADARMYTQKQEHKASRA